MQTLKKIGSGVQLLIVPGNTGLGAFDGVWVGGLEVVLGVIVVVLSRFVGELVPVTMVVVTAVRSAVTVLVTVEVPRTRLVAVLIIMLVLVITRVEVSKSRLVDVAKTRLV